MIVDEAIKLGACDLIKGISKEKDLVRLFFSPQGREFCIKNNFPSHDYFRSLNLESYNIYVDKKYVSITDEDIALIHSHGVLTFTKGFHKVILMHGATANIQKGKFACVTVEGEGATWLDN